MSEEECAANVAAAIQGALQHIPRKLANVRALHLKMADSAALPIYQALPEVPMRIAGAKVDAAGVAEAAATDAA